MARRLLRSAAVAVHLIGQQPGALLELPSGCAFKRALRVVGTGGGLAIGGTAAQRRAAALALLREAVVQCPRRGPIPGAECVDCSHLMAWRVTPDVVLYCGAEDDDPVRDWMRAPPPLTTVGTTCDAADAEAARLGVHHLLVLDGERRLVGVACRHDLGRGGSRPVETQMSSDVFAVDPGTQLGAAATAMRRLKLGCLPVVAGELLVGVVTRSDLARAGVVVECR